MRFRFLLLAALLLVARLPSAFCAESTPKQLENVGLNPVLGTQLPLDAELVDEAGKVRPLSDWFDGRRPVLLVMSYYECPMLCGLVLNGVRKSVGELSWLPGDHYQIVTISIDPDEGPKLAAAKKASIANAFAKPEQRDAAAKSWAFLVGKSGSEKRIADAVGFGYQWDEATSQWAHGAAIFLVSPTGKLTRALFGLEYPARDLKLGLLEAGEGKVGTLAEKLMLFCYHYDPKGNKYAILATRLVSLGGALTVALMLVAWLAWYLGQRRKGNSYSHE